MHLNFRKLLKAEAMRFDMHTHVRPAAEEMWENFDPLSPRNLNRIREEVIGEISELLNQTGEITNTHRLCKDLLNREKKAATAMGEGIAIPHVRTLQAKSFVMAFCRSQEGLPFSAPDDKPVRLFFTMVAPPYEDKMYLRVYRSLAGVFMNQEKLQVFFHATTPNEIWEVLENFSF